MRYYPEPCPAPVRKALDHVRDFHPEVNHVVFTSEGRWLYMNEIGYTPVFGKQIDTSILESAADAVDGFPAVFCIITED